MKWSDITETVGEYAPLVGSLLGGKAGGMVGELVADALGVDNDAKAVKAALRDPANQVKLAEFAHQEKMQLRQLTFQTAQDERRDRQNARETHKDHWMPSALTIIFLIVTSLITTGLFFIAIPKENRDILVYMVGQISGWTGAGIAYWVSTSNSSNNKNKMLENVSRRPDG